ncbi:ADP-ribosylglycohydrolase family protein [Streptomyces litchfieldiae]|uniref:ADP-ribosylglycohydrolase family protein n=1 Tax=Streptomyces litchfieldiae TaxID=3075543 RepID=A0ABU2MXM8_9ACTN|nr:ADP-ribosylglycohydrolase family protein [Streptomyces sp. DSM 44938]MDT0346391.1 ADP-ribosylglycohydrolase family protein [Streptomyces sp. DSM 44938]
MRSSHAAATDSLHGLALGDAFGERWFPLMRGPAEARAQIRARTTPAEPVWHWTDDTAMALGVLRALRADGEIRPERLARVFADTYRADPARGYGYGMHQLLPRLAGDPAAWQAGAAELFGGQGSLGNGAAMRVAPLGAWFAGEPERVVAQAELSARVTHHHPEGVAGAVAVAVAAACAAGPPDPGERAPAFLRQVARRTPPSAVRDRLYRAAELSGDVPPWRAADLLGNGQRIRADDTVPFALWSAARHLDSLVDALWTTAEGLGDVDTTCAITGGVVAARTGLAGVPAEWLARREPLPAWVDAVSRD